MMLLLCCLGVQVRCKCFDVAAKFLLSLRLMIVCLLCLALWHMLVLWRWFLLFDSHVVQRIFVGQFYGRLFL